MSTTTPTSTATTRHSKPPRPSRTLGLAARDRTRSLPADALACRSCGVAVASPSAERVEVLRSIYVDAGPILGLRVAAQPLEVRVSRCAECDDRRERAEALVARFRLGRVFGNVAADHLDAALAALDVLGIRRDRTASLTGSAADARGFAIALAHVGSAATWAALFQPVLRAGAGPDECAPQRWGHVTAEHVRLIAEEYRTLVHRRMELPFPFAPPSDGVPGCLLCGVGALRVKESDAAAAWGTLRRASPGTLGGRSRPELIAGYLCPECRSVVDSVGGALGMRAVERGIMRHLGYTVKPGAWVEFHRVAAWVALPPGVEPNATPWAHLNLPRIQRALDRTRQVQRDSAKGVAR